MIYLLTFLEVRRRLVGHLACQSLFPEWAGGFTSMLLIALVYFSHTSAVKLSDNTGGNKNYMDFFQRIQDKAHEREKLRNQ